MKKRIVLCADDYGQDQEISEAILTLLQKKCLSATSCMVTHADWKNHLKSLLSFQNKIDTGLHLNLTEGTPASQAFKSCYGSRLFTLPALLRMAFLGTLKVEVILAECEAQLDRFRDVMGRSPDFFDGHQHVHQFPIVRDALLAVYRKRGQKGYMRMVNPVIFSNGIKNTLKKGIIWFTGSGPFKVLIEKAGIPHNTSFSGIYAFEQSPRYYELFRVFLTEITDNGILMCHPGFSASRFDEYQYFASEQFSRDCANASVEVGRGGSFNV